MNMKVTGRCHCGQIAYEAEVDPARAQVCHCTDCQRLSGSAYRVNVPAPAETFVLRSGRLSTYLKTAESGSQRIQAFCGNCGAPVYSAAPVEPKMYSLRIGGLDQAALLAPMRQIWRRSALQWAQDIHELPQVPTQ